MISVPRDTHAEIVGKDTEEKSITPMPMVVQIWQ